MKKVLFIFHVFIFVWGGAWRGCRVGVGTVGGVAESPKPHGPLRPYPDTPKDTRLELPSLVFPKAPARPHTLDCAAAAARTSALCTMASRATEEFTPRPCDPTAHATEEFYTQTTEQSHTKTPSLILGSGEKCRETHLPETFVQPRKSKDSPTDSIIKIQRGSDLGSRFLHGVI